MFFPVPLFENFLKTVADYTSPDLIVPELLSDTADGVITELCGTLERAGRLHDPPAFQAAVRARELMSPTSFSEGWALPHARLKGLSQLSFALARTRQPVVWPGDGRARVQTVFLFAVPEFEARTYLNLISALAKLNQTSDLLQQLLSAPDARSMYEVLEEVPLRRPQPPALATGVIRSLRAR
jgi:mannitol/fructose-specific phosphotransferase system IIA component (Ntr-type)